MERDEDMELTRLYEGSGLFAKIIDTPAEEAFRAGFSIKGNVPGDVVENAVDLLDWLHWEEKAAVAVKWARLYGGSLVVMLINDGGGIEEPLRLDKVRSVDGLMVYDRSIVRPSPVDMIDGSYPMPEFYKVFGRYGTFTIHESRCLIFRNGKLLERLPSWHLWPWGIPEAYRIYEALTGAETAHGNAVRLLDKSIQPVYKIHELSKILETMEGEAQVLRRLDTVDLSRGLANTIAVDMKDDFSYLGEIPAGVDKMVDMSDQLLSAVTRIPQQILFGYKRPDHPNNLGSHKKDFGSKKDKRIRIHQHRDIGLESWYSYIEELQKGMVKQNLWRLLSIIFQAEVNAGALPRLPKFDVEFLPLWYSDDLKQAHIGLKKAERQMSEAQTAAMYVGMGVVSRKEVRRGLKKARKK